MPRNPFKKISNKTTKKKLIKHLLYLQKVLTSYYENRNKYGKVFKLLKQNKNTSTVDFINKYHKNYHFWTNKLAYLAGLIDGEGYLKVEKWGTIRLIIGMTDRKTIYWIKNNFGGNVRKQLTAKKKNFYVWRMNQGKNLFYLLLLVIPFLITKKRKLVKAMEQLIKKIEQLEHTLGYFAKL